MSQEQSQGQSQALNLVVNLDNSGNPQFEQHVFNNLYSVGRQLARVSAVLEGVLSALEGNAALQAPVAANAIDEFKQMQRAIAKAKDERKPEQAIMRQLAELSKSDPDEHARVSAALRSYLNT
jgi:beta-phosphoglucomutase-like phosphatase (HAD superfamily)